MSIRVFSFSLAVFIALSLLTACGGGDGTTDTSDISDTSGTSGTSDTSDTTGTTDTSDTTGTIESDTSGSCAAESGASGLAVLKIDNDSSDIAMVIADSDGNGIVVYQKVSGGVPNLNGVAFTYSDCATGVWVTGDSGEPVSYAVAAHEFTFRNYTTRTTSGDTTGAPPGRGGTGTPSSGGTGTPSGPFEGGDDGGGGTTTTTTKYTSTDVGKAIADDSTTTSTLAVSSTGTVSSMTVGLTIQHNWDEDLDIYLLSPSGARIELSTDNGSRGDHYTSTVFSNSGINITSGTAPFTGTYQPEGSLSSFNGESINGTWTLQITDDTPQNAGTLVSWYIEITTSSSKSDGLSAFDGQVVRYVANSCSVPTSNSSGSDSATEVDIVYTDPDCNQQTYSNQSLSKPSASIEGYGERYLGKVIWDAAVAFIGKSGGSPVYSIINTKETISIYANNITKWTSSYISGGTTREITSSINMVGDDVEKNSQNLVYWLRGITSGATGGNSSSLIKQSVRFTTSEQAEFDSQTSAISFN